MPPIRRGGWLTASPPPAWSRTGSAAMPCCGTSPCSARPRLGFLRRQRSGFRTSSGSGPHGCETGSCTATGPIDVEILYTTATEQLPAFVADLRRVLAALTAEADDNPERAES